jgi:hypothetical protein
MNQTRPAEKKVKLSQWMAGFEQPMDTCNQGFRTQFDYVLQKIGLNTSGPSTAEEKYMNCATGCQVGSMWVDNRCHVITLQWLCAPNIGSVHGVELGQEFEFNLGLNKNRGQTPALCSGSTLTLWG